MTFYVHMTLHNHCVVPIIIIIIIVIMVVIVLTLGQILRKIQRTNKINVLCLLLSFYVATRPYS